MDVMFQKLALRGTSIMFASGDGGVAGGQSGACRPGASPYQGVPRGGAAMTPIPTLPLLQARSSCRPSPRAAPL